MKKRTPPTFNPMPLCKQGNVAKLVPSSQSAWEKDFGQWLGVGSAYRTSCLLGKSVLVFTMHLAMGLSLSLLLFGDKSSSPLKLLQRRQERSHLPSVSFNRNKAWSEPQKSAETRRSQKFRKRGISRTSLHALLGIRLPYELDSPRSTAQ